MSTFFGGLAVLLLAETIMNIWSAKGGVIKRLGVGAWGFSKKSRAFAAICVIVPLAAFLLSGFAWVLSHPMELVVEGAAEPYGEFDYLVGPAPIDITTLKGMQLRFMVALRQTEASLEAVENFVQPCFVAMNSGIVWIWRYKLALLAAVACLEILLFAMGKRGPFRRGLAALFNADAKPGKLESIVLGNCIVTVLGLLYFSAAFAKEAENARQAVLPLLSDLVGAFRALGVESDQLWVDAATTTLRFIAGLALIMFAIPVGIAMANFPRINKTFDRFMLWFADKINAFAIVVLVFFIFQTMFESKEPLRIGLALLAVFPSVALDAALATKDVPERLIQRTRTYGATHIEVAYRRIIKMIFPRVMNTIRLNIKVVVGILISAESIGGITGLGLRISLQERHIECAKIMVMNLFLLIICIAADSGIKWIIKKTSPYWKL